MHETSRPIRTQELIGYHGNKAKLGSLGEVPVNELVAMTTTKNNNKKISPLSSSLCPLLSHLPSSPCPLLSSLCTPPHPTTPFLHSTPLHSTPLHSTPLHSTPLHSTPLHSTPLHSTPLHSTPLHSTPLHSTPLHSTPLHSTPLHSTPLHSTPLHSTPLHSTPLHSTPLHSTPLHSTPLHSTPLHSTPLSLSTLRWLSRESNSGLPLWRWCSYHCASERSMQGVIQIYILLLACTRGAAAVQRSTISKLKDSYSKIKEETLPHVCQWRDEESNQRIEFLVVFFRLSVYYCYFEERGGWGRKLSRGRGGSLVLLTGPSPPSSTQLNEILNYYDEKGRKVSVMSG